jgi:hypothetical protein
MLIKQDNLSKDEIVAKWKKTIEVRINEENVRDKKSF